MMMEQQLNHTRLLPEDVLTQVLCRLTPRDLAISRCVCVEWKDNIDDRCLLRTEDLLPLSVGGIFINFSQYYCSEFFRPWRRAHDGTPTLFSAGSSLSNVWKSCWEVVGHCNGLLLLHASVANPAAGWRAPLPPRPAIGFHYRAYIAFDPIVSSHYSVFLIDYAFLYCKPIDPAREVAATQLWPPSPYLFHVFSSRTGRWEERPFHRDREAVGSIGDVGLGKPWLSACWKQALYVLCGNNFVLRISLSKDEYQVIKMPAGVWIQMIGKSEKGLYAAGYSTDRCLKVWILNESSSHEHEWVLRHNKLVRPLVSARCCLDKPVCGPWVLEDIYFYAAYCSDPYNNQDAEECKEDKAAEVAASREKFSNWTSDDDDDFFVDAEDSDEGSSHIDHLLVLGFHPFKEIIFLQDESSRIAVAYGLKSSKFQYFEGHGHGEFIEGSFVYTPCKLDAP